MKEDVLLYRQIHPNNIQNGYASTLAFTPSKKDNNKLSVYNSLLISAEDSWVHYTSKGLKSFGVEGVIVKECTDNNLDAKPDPLDGFQEHAVIDFLDATKSKAEKYASILKQKANARGWLFPQSKE